MSRKANSWRSGSWKIQHAAAATATIEFNDNVVPVKLNAPLRPPKQEWSLVNTSLNWLWRNKWDPSLITVSARFGHDGMADAQPFEHDLKKHADVNSLLGDRDAAYAQVLP
jgi:hypothetical protein